MTVLGGTRLFSLRRLRFLLCSLPCVLPLAVRRYLILLCGGALFCSAGAAWAASATAADPPTSKVALTPAEQRFLAAHPRIVLGTDASWEPYVIATPNQPVRGYDADILAHINTVTGAQFELTAGEWQTMIAAARRREIDGLSTSAVHAERRDFVDFSEPYAVLEKFVIVAVGNPQGIRGPADLANKVIAIHRGNLKDEKIARRFARSKTLVLDSADDTLRAVIEGRADAAFGNGASLHRAARLGLPYVQYSFALNERLEVVFSLRNDWPEALSILNKGLATLSESERLKMQTRWFALPETSPAPPRLALSSKELAWREQAGKLRYCIDPKLMPIEGLDAQGAHVGMTREYLDLLGERLQLAFELVSTTSWDDARQALRNGRCDLLTAAMNLPERAQEMRFTQPYIRFPLAIATRKEELFIDKLEALDGQRLGVVRGFASEQILRQHHPGLTLIPVEHIGDGLRRIESGSLFGLIDLIPTIGWEIQRSGNFNQKIAGKFDAEITLSLAVRPEATVLQGLLDKGLASISASEHAAISARWLTLRIEQGINRALLWQLLAGAGLLLAFLLYRHTLLLRFNRRLAGINLTLEKLYRTDSLTGLANRYLINESVAREYARAHRNGETFALILADIDHFKAINDTFGHTVGDKVLIQFSEVLRQRARASDTVGRWGGEEFMLICPQCDLDSARQLAESLRLAIEKTLFSQAIQLTASFGVAELGPEESTEALLQRTDQNLYRAKQQRNCVSAEAGERRGAGAAPG